MERSLVVVGLVISCLSVGVACRPERTLGDNVAGSGGTLSGGGAGGAAAGQGGAGGTAGSAGTPEGGTAGLAGVGGTAGAAGAVTAGTSGAAGDTIAGAAGTAGVPAGGTGGTAGTPAGGTAGTPPIAGAAGAPIAGAGGVAGAAGAVGAAGSGGSTSGFGDPAQFNFEQDAQKWADIRGNGIVPLRSSITSFAGFSALQIPLATTGGDDATGNRFIGVISSTMEPNPLLAGLTPGKEITFRVLYPAGAPMVAIQPFIQDKFGNGLRWTGTWMVAQALPAGQWNAIKLKVPGDAGAIMELGVQFRTSAAWNGSVFVDSITW